MGDPGIRMGVSGGVLAVALGLLAGACGSASQQDARRGELRPFRDVVLITADTLRHDATGFSGAGRVETPMLDRLAQDAAVFTSARAHAVVTLPSHASILTGHYPFEHGIHDNAGFVLADGMDTLATILSARGWATGAFVSALPLDRRFGLARGFEVYDDEYEGYGDGRTTLPERPARETVARATAWWTANAARPRFLWVHVFTPHFPYAPEEPYATRYRDAPYFGEVATMDAQLRPLLEPLLAAGADAPLIVFTADHGESLGEHGEETHGTFAYDSTLLVPLVIRAPGRIPAGGRPDSAWHVDILPTTLELLGLPVPAGLPGRSLVARAPDPQAVEGYFEALAPYFNRGWAPLTGLVRGGRKAIRLPLPELYDLRRDPREQANLAGGERPDLDRILAGLPPLGRILTARAEVDPETLTQLRSLGYAAGNTRPDPAAASDPARDPKELIQLERLLDAALTARSRGDDEGAVRILRDVLARQPDMTIASTRLAESLVELGREREAIDWLVAARGRGVSDESSRRVLALAYLRVGQAGTGWEVLQQDQASRDPETLVVLGRLLGQIGRGADAREMFDRALAIDPTFPAAHVDRAILTMMEGHADEAREELESALQRDPFHAEGWNALGVIHSGAGRLKDALAAWERAVEVDPRLADALYNLAAGRARNGELAQAIAAMQRYSDLVSGQEQVRARQILDDLRRRAGRS